MRCAASFMLFLLRFYMATRQGLYRAMRHAFVTPRRHVLRGTGELNLRIPNGDLCKSPVRIQSFLGGFSLLAGKEILIKQFRFSKTVVACRVVYVEATENHISIN